jgi:hypothetical protein
LLPLTLLSSALLASALLPLALLPCGLGHLASELIQFFTEPLGARELFGELARFGVVRAGRGRELVGNLVERPREILLRSRLRPGFLAWLPTASPGRVAGAAHRLGGLLHPLGKPLALEILPRFRRCRSSGRTGGLRRLPLQPLLQCARTRGQPLLLAGEAPHGVACGVALRRSCELRGELALLVGELARLELHVAEGTPPLVRLGGLELALELPELLERAAARGRRLPGILAPQVVGRVAHRFGRIAHLLLVRLAGFAGLARLPRLARTARPAGLTFPAGTALLGLLTVG